MACFHRTVFLDILLLLLLIVDLRKVSRDFLLSVACDEARVDLPSWYKPVVTTIWRAAHSASRGAPLSHAA